MDWLIVIAVVGAGAIWYQRRKRGSTYAVDEPLTSESLRKVPSHLRNHLIEADIIVRDYLKVNRGGSSVGNPLRSRSELNHSVAAIKNSLILVATFRVGRAVDTTEILRHLREAYQGLAFFPPTPAEAEDEWENSGKDEDARAEASRARSPDIRSLAGAMRESGRLAKEFENELTAIASPVGT